MTVIVDTGVLLAVADADDADHERCAQLDTIFALGSVDAWMWRDTR